MNLPFLLWSPRAWIAGVLEPVISPMITFGQGLSLLTMLGISVVPKWVYSLFMVGALALSLLVYLRHFHRLRPLVWILPDLDAFNQSSRVVHEQPIGWAQVGWTGLYGLAYGVVLIVLAAWIFSRKDLV